LLLACRHETRRRFKRVDGPPQQFVDKLAKRFGRDGERLFGLRRRPPAEPVFPDEAEWAAEEQLQRGRRLRAAERTRDRRVIGAESAVMRGQAAHMPVPPALRRRLDAVDRRRFVRARHQPIRLAEGMLGNAGTRERALLRTSRNQRAGAEAISLRVAAAARYGQGAARTADDDCKVTSIRLRHRIGIKLRCRNDVVRQNRVVRFAPRPTSASQAEEPNAGPRPRRQMRGGTPHDGIAGIALVGETNVLQRELDRVGGRGPQRRLPNGLRTSPQQQRLSFRSRARSLRERAENGQQGRANIDCTSVKLQTAERALPILQAEEGRAARQSRKPTGRQPVQSRAFSRAERDHPPNTLLTQSAHQHIRDGGAALTVPDAQGRNAVGEMDSQARVRGEGENMLVP
jgi:hypothetical protein